MEKVTRKEAIEHASSLNFNGMWATEFACQNHYEHFGELGQFVVDCIKAVEAKHKMLYHSHQESVGHLWILMRKECLN